MKKLKIVLLAFAFLGTAFCGSSKKKVALENDKNPQYQYEMALVAMQYKLPDEALKYLDLALSLDPRHYQALNLLGVIQLNKKNYAEAAAALEKCLEIRSDVPEVHTNLGTAYQNLGQKDKAETEFRKAFALNQSAYAAFSLAQFFYEKKDPAQALEFIEKAIRGSKKGEAAYFNLQGIVLNQLERYPEALASFLAGLALMPGDVNMRVNLGITYVNNKQPDKARETFEKVLPLIKDQALIKRVKDYLEVMKNSPAGRWGRISF